MLVRAGQVLQQPQVLCVRRGCLLDEALFEG